MRIDRQVSGVDLIERMGINRHVSSVYDNLIIYVHVSGVESQRRNQIGIDRQVSGVDLFEQM
jgi:hypothetical protein